MSGDSMSAVSGERSRRVSQVQSGQGESRDPAVSSDRLTPRRILLVAGFFPPLAPSGSTRAPSLARHWLAQGHDVRVLSARNRLTSKVLKHELPEERVTFVPFPEVESLREAAAFHLFGRVPPTPADGGGSPATPPAGAGGGTPRLASLPYRKQIADLYWDMMFIPDKHLFWSRTATTAGRALVERWKPDLLYSSGPPHSGHIVARHLAAACGAPWVAELRDEWAGNPYGVQNWLRTIIERRMERRTLHDATALVAVTRTTQRTLDQLHGKPVALSMNGYDPVDFDGLETVTPLDPDKLTIVHAGSIYIGKRDPSSLFAATARLGALASRVNLLFYGEQADSLASLARHYGVEASVTISPPITRREVLEIERRADVLLLCRWNDPAEDGIIPGKLFEYIGARRPILVIGSETGEAAEIVREGQFGLVSNDPDRLAAQLRGWIEAKAQTPRLEDVPNISGRDYTRAGQFDALDSFLARTLA